MRKPEFPTKRRIKKAIRHFKRSKDEDLEFCIKLLEDRLQNPENPYFEATEEEEVDRMVEIYTEQLKEVEKLPTIRQRTLGVICVDWLNGSDINLEKIKL